MSSLGIHFAITTQQVEEVTAAALEGDGAVRDWIEALEERWDEASLYQSDKAWDAIHRCLTGDVTPDPYLDQIAGQPPLNLCILGGEQLYEGNEYTVALVRPEEVAGVAYALSELDELWLRKRFFALDSKVCGYAIDEEQFKYTLAHFLPLSSFFFRAAGEGQGVIFTVHH
jgi:hypothetical protein